MKNLLLIISVCFTSLLFAQDRVARVLKVTSSKKYALIKHLSSYDASVGNTLNIETSDGGSCQVKILKSMGNNRVIVGLKDCSVRNSVQRGDWISKSAIVVQDEFEEFEEEEQQPQRKMEKKKRPKVIQWPVIMFSFFIIWPASLLGMEQQIQVLNIN